MDAPRIVEMEPRLLIGLRIATTLAKNQTAALWQRFQPRRKEIAHQLPGALYSVEVYDEAFTRGEFSPVTRFEKWAAVAVSETSAVPEGMEVLVLPAGKYAVFTHKGLHSAALEAFAYIFREWLPASGYRLDPRPHVEVMGEKYHGPHDPYSEEDFWIPIQ